VLLHYQNKIVSSLILPYIREINGARAALFPDKLSGIFHSILLGVTFPDFSPRIRLLAGNSYG
jgi:hypothetical protein